MSKVVSVLSGVLVLIGLSCLVYTAGYMVHSYRVAEAELAYCEADGLADCHIERDGLEFNVYGEEN